MKQPTYTDAPPEINKITEHGTIAPDHWFPSPERMKELVDKQKITLLISRSTLEKFKTAAQEHGLKYQTMINQVLTYYAREHLK
jgi:uncharacterized protein (DUF4415 family)